MEPKFPVSIKLLLYMSIIILKMEDFINKNRINCSINSLIQQILKSKFMKIKENDVILIFFVFALIMNSKRQNIF